MHSDDLAPLLSFAGRFGPGGDPASGDGDLGFHMGTVTAWNARTGENTLQVAGATVSDVPVLSTADSIMLNVGDQVGLIRFRSTYFILGRIAPPGGGAAMGIRSASVSTRELLELPDPTDVYTDLPTPGPTLRDVYIGSSRRCLVLASAIVGMLNSAGWFSFEVSGASSIPAINQTAAGGGLNNNANGGSSLNVNTTAVRVLTADDGLQSGLNTFQMKYLYQVANDGTWARFEERSLTVFPF